MEGAPCGKHSGGNLHINTLPLLSFPSAEITDSAINNQAEYMLGSHGPASTDLLSV